MTTPLTDKEREFEEVVRQLKADPKFKKEALAQIQQAQAQVSLVAFMKRMMPILAPGVKKGTDVPRHVKYWASILEKLERYEIKKLAISAAPGHSKSTIAQAFTAWFIGRNPTRRVLFVSAEESLALRNAGVVRGMVTSDEWPFPDVELVGKSLEEWKTTKGGGVRSAGKTGTTTGRRAELILVDDIQKDAGTKESREADQIFFDSILVPRLEPNPRDGLMIILANRYHDLDLIGRLQNAEVTKDSKDWVYLNIPAIAEEDHDELGRMKGEPLWPEKVPIEVLQEEKERLGPISFTGLYQCNPIPSEGYLFKPEWFNQRYDGLPVGYSPQVSEEERILREYSSTVSTPRPKNYAVIQAVDSAWKTGPQNDRSVIVTLSGDGRNIYVIDVWYGRAEFPDLSRKLMEKYEQFKPSRVYVEEAASGYALVQSLRAGTGIPIVGVKPGSDAKEARVQAITGFWESGRVWLPRQDAWWYRDFLDEHLRFPLGRFDDIPDATSLGIRMMRQLMSQWQEDEIDEYGDELGGFFGR